VFNWINLPQGLGFDLVGSLQEPALSQNKFLPVLFYTFLALFCLTAAIELCALVGWVHLDPTYEAKLFTAVIVEVAGSIFAFWKQLSGGKFSEPPAVDGGWEYECVREDGTYKHGGVCKLFVTREALGWEFSIQGRRTWIANNVNNQWQRKDLPAPYSWDSSWGTFTGNDSLRFEYSLNAEEKSIHGYGWMSITSHDASKPAELVGNSYQLPPFEPFYGSLRFWRTSKQDPS